MAAAQQRHHKGYVERVLANLRCSDIKDVVDEFSLVPADNSKPLVPMRAHEPKPQGDYIDDAFVLVVTSTYGGSVRVTSPLEVFVPVRPYVETDLVSKEGRTIKKGSFLPVFNGGDWIPLIGVHAEQVALSVHLWLVENLGTPLNA